MTIFTDTPTRSSTLNEFETPLGADLAAVAETALIFSPLSSIQRAGELAKAEKGNPRGFFGILGRYEPDSPLLAADDAKQRVIDAGVDLEIPETGIRSRALDILIDRKKNENRRQDAISRGGKGIGMSAARLAVGFGASVLDPLNVASAFIPIVGEARYARLLGNAAGGFGRAGVRARVGAIEGTVGAAIVEPLIYHAAKQEQADYALSDSLLNIAMGTVLGGGLHVGIGAAGDALGKGQSWRTARAVDPLPRALEDVDYRTREAALRTAVAQAVTGRAIDVESVLPEGITTTVVPSNVGEKSAPTFDAVDKLSVASVIGDRVDNLPTRSEPASRTIYIAPEAAAQLDLPVRSEWRVVDNGNGTVSVATRRRGKWNLGSAETQVAFASEPSPNAIAVTLGGREALPAGEGYASARIGPEGPERRSRRREVSTQTAAKLRTAGIQEAARRNNDPASFRMVEQDNVRIGDERISALDRQSIDAANETGVLEAVEDAQRLAEAVGLSAEAQAVLAPYDALQDTAAAYGRAVLAAASCQLRRGA